MLSEFLSGNISPLAHHHFYSRHLQIQGVHVVLSENTNSQPVVDEPVAISQFQISTQSLYKS